MAIFNGIYEWDGKKHNDEEPIAWFAGSYSVTILATDSGTSGNVETLKSHICLYQGTGKGQSISANPEKFARKICFDFGLELDRVLWVEEASVESGDFEVICYSRTAKVGETVFHKITKRSPLASEMSYIEAALAERIAA